ncbi:MAG: hypothetical protein JXQ96_04380 [Cyclobacteriaceae bacterium]
MTKQKLPNDLLGEYRLVPIQEEHEFDNEGRIDIKDFFSFISQKLKLLFVASIVGILLGVFIALTISKEYDARALLIPESGGTSTSGASSLLRQYGGLIGIGGGISANQENSIPPLLFPEIVKSVPFQVELLTSVIRFSNINKEVSTYSYFRDFHRPSILYSVKEYTIGLPQKILSAAKSEKKDEYELLSFSGKDSLITFSVGQLKLINDMQERIRLVISQETGIVELKVTLPDPQAAADLASISIQLLTKYVVGYKIGMAKANLAFIEQRLNEARHRFEQIQLEYARFGDRNMNINSSEFKIRESKLQTEHDLAFEIFKTLLKEFEQAKIKVQEDTPVVTVLEPVIVPIEDNVSGLIILIRTVFVVLFLSFMGLVIMYFYKRINHTL